MRIYYKTYFRCDTELDVIAGFFDIEVSQLVQSFTFNGVLETDGTYSAAPVWFSENSTDYPLYDLTWIFTPPAETNTHYRFSWTATYHTGEEVEYIVELVMLDYCNTTVDNNPCSGTTGNNTVLAWLNRQGGWSYFLFTGKTTFDNRNPDAKTYVDTSYVKRNTSRREAYSGEILSTGSIPQISIDLLESLKEAIQVFKVKDYGQLTQEFIPIILEDGDFIKRKTGDKLFDFKIKFFYSTERVIQSM